MHLIERQSLLYKSKLTVTDINEIYQMKNTSEAKLALTQ